MGFKILSLQGEFYPNVISSKKIKKNIKKCVLEWLLETSLPITTGLR